MQKKRTQETIKLRGIKVSRFAKIPAGYASEELARTCAKELLEVKLARMGNLRGKRWDAMNRIWVGHVPVV